MRKSGSGAHATTDRLSEYAHESVDQVARTAGKAEACIRKEASGAEARVRDAGQKARKRSDDTLEAVSDYMRDNLLVSVGLAFAAGALLSFLRRRS